jgi:hypothetical protein
LKGIVHVPIPIGKDGECQDAILLCFEFQNAILVERTIDYDFVVNKHIPSTERNWRIIFLTPKAFAKLNFDGI